ncbi:energy transducer TonB [Gramella sp. AN32]|uniref:Energy transducer TonB n=1 Tax=Christiangramia antarctica TaxID=2058158 RepID=A0ABW5X2E2_9FLAO|nr:energy transducer TonB [Gramella sp. AN32]MCM4156336.1 hypothetical protein [Gramella sp. AN32]
MDFFEKHKALIITSLLFAILVLVLYNFNLAQNRQQVSEMLVDLEQFKVEEQPEEPETEQETQSQNQRNIQTNQAFNESKEARDADMNNRLNEIFEKNTANQEAEENNENSNADGNYALSRKNSEKQKTKSDGNDNSDEIGQKSAVYDYSSISFSLKGRNAVKIPNPVYTCDNAGKIVVNIIVDANGFVTDVSLNKGSSNSSNECLTERALQYAIDARFTRLTGQNSQPGTITYYFRS